MLKVRYNNVQGSIRIGNLFTRKNDIFLNQEMYMILIRFRQHKKTAAQRVMRTAVSFYFLLKSGLARNSIAAGASA